MFLNFFLTLMFASASIQEPNVCDVYFSPKDHLHERLIHRIENEQKSIRVAIFYLTHTGIAKALVKAKERGVNVEIVIDPSSIKAHSPLHYLIDAKIPIYVWDPALNWSNGKKTQKKSPKMHDKFCIFGDHLVWTGSFNFTIDAALRNEENAVLINHPEVAKKFSDHFLDLKIYHCRPYQEYLLLNPKRVSTKGKN